MMTRLIGYFHQQSKFHPLILFCFCILIALSFIQNYSFAQEVYQMPPKAIADIVDAPPTPSLDFSPDHQWLLIMDRSSLPSIGELSQPELRIAGIRINPRTNGSSRARYYSKLTLKNIRNGKEKVIEFPYPFSKFLQVLERYYD